MVLYSIVFYVIIDCHHSKPLPLAFLNIVFVLRLHFSYNCLYFFPNLIVVYKIVIEAEPLDYPENTNIGTQRETGNLVSTTAVGILIYMLAVAPYNFISDTNTAT